MMDVSAVHYVVSVVNGQKRIYIEFYGDSHQGEVAILV